MICVGYMCLRYLSLLSNCKKMLTSHIICSLFIISSFFLSEQLYLTSIKIWIVVQRTMDLSGLYGQSTTIR